MIKAIIFDNGGVIVFDAWKEYKKRVYKKLGTSLADVNGRITFYEGQATSGNITFKEVLEIFEEKLGTNYAQNELTKWRPISNSMRNLLLELKGKYILALLTNELGDFFRENRHMHYEEYFGKNIFTSSTMRIKKPNPEVFLYTLNKLGVKPQEVIFIDDKARNVKAASALGINVIQFKSINKLKIDIEKIVKNAEK